MNIPPLISRTPPPIHDAVDDEDEDDEDRVSPFPSINFISPKTPEKSPENLCGVGVDGFDTKIKSRGVEETNGVNSLSKTESCNQENLQSPVFISEVKEEDCSTVLSKNHLDETSLNGQSVFASNSLCVRDSFDQNINDFTSEEPLQISLNNVDTESDWQEDFSHYQSCQFDDVDQTNEGPIVQRENVTSEGEIPSADVDCSCPIENVSDGRSFKLDDESDVRNDLDESKVFDIRLVKGKEETPLSLNSEGINNCYCVDKCSCVDIIENICESEEQVYDNDDSAYDDDSEFGEYKFESALPSDSIDYTDQDPLSSQFTLECDRVNVSVTKDSESSPVESNDRNHFSGKELSLEGNLTVQYNESSEANRDPGPASVSEPVPPEFSVTFPEVVQNYQLDQPSKDFNDDDEFSDFVECTYAPCPVPEKEPHPSIEQYQVFSGGLEDQISPILLLCLKEELLNTTVWSKLSSLEHTPALDYKWGNSYTSSRLLSALKIDSRNILSGQWSKLRKLTSDDYRGHIDHIDSYPEIGFNKASVPNPQFEWVGSGLINPLDDVGGRVKKSSNALLSSEAESMISSFPDLSFIKQSFIVFPKNID